MTDSEQQPNELRLSQLPSSMKASARLLIKELDTNGDGTIDVQEFAAAVNSLKDHRKSNKYLTKAVTALTVASLLLIGAVFGASIAAARLAKDTVADSSGMLYEKNTGATIQTAGALVPIDESIVDMSIDELLHLKEIVLEVKTPILLNTLEPAGDEEAPEDEPAPKILKMKKKKIDEVEIWENGIVVLILKGGGKLTFTKIESVANKVNSQRMEISDDLFDSFFPHGNHRQRRLEEENIKARIYSDITACR